jgi:hypothetical protein
VPTVLRVGPYRFFFSSNEGTEPPHIHVEAGSASAKFWLQPVALSTTMGLQEKRNEKSNVSWWRAEMS